MPDRSALHTASLAPSRKTLAPLYTRTRKEREQIIVCLSTVFLCTFLGNNNDENLLHLATHSKISIHFRVVHVSLIRAVGSAVSGALGRYRVEEPLEEKTHVCTDFTASNAVRYFSAFVSRTINRSFCIVESAIEL